MKIRTYKFNTICCLLVPSTCSLLPLLTVTLVTNTSYHQDNRKTTEDYSLVAHDAVLTRNLLPIEVYQQRLRLRRKWKQQALPKRRQQKSRQHSCYPRRPIFIDKAVETSNHRRKQVFRSVMYWFVQTYISVYVYWEICMLLSQRHKLTWSSFYSRVSTVANLDIRETPYSIVRAVLITQLWDFLTGWEESGLRPRDRRVASSALLLLRRILSAQSNSPLIKWD